MNVVLLMAITLDGKIGRDSDHYPDWTGNADKRLFVAITRRAGALIMGSRTFDTIGEPLPGRKNVVMTRNRRRVSRWENLVFTDKAPREVLADLEADGFTEVILAGGTQINTLFAQAQLIDEIAVTVSPLIFGRGLSLFAEKTAMSLELLAVDRLDADRVHLHYRVLRPAIPQD